MAPVAPFSRDFNLHSEPVVGPTLGKARIDRMQQALPFNFTAKCLQFQEGFVFDAVSVSEVVFPAPGYCYCCFFCERMMRDSILDPWLPPYLCVCVSVCPSIHPPILF